MEIELIVFVTAFFCCFTSLVLCNYLVKINKIHSQWKTHADRVWLFSLIPGVNVVVFAIMVSVIVCYLTKNFIEQNDKEKL